MGRKGWDGGKHRSPGIPPIPPYQISQAPKRYFAKFFFLKRRQISGRRRKSRRRQSQEGDKSQGEKNQEGDKKIYGAGQDRRLADGHFNTMNRPGLRAG